MRLSSGHVHANRTRCAKVGRPSGPPDQKTAKVWRAPNVKGTPMDAGLRLLKLGRSLQCSASHKSSLSGRILVAAGFAGASAPPRWCALRRPLCLPRCRGCRAAWLAARHTWWLTLDRALLPPHSKSSCRHRREPRDHRAGRPRRTHFSSDFAV